jgi:hypothetical protein
MPFRPAFRTRANGSRLQFYVHWRDLIGRHIAKYGVHEPLLTAWIADRLPNIHRLKLWWHSSPIRSIIGCSIAT